jgi:hypothetical protein
MSKKKKNPPAEIYVCHWSPGKHPPMGFYSYRADRKIRTQEEAYALQRRLLKKAKRMLDAKRPLNASHFMQALLAIEPGAWVREYGRAISNTRMVSFKARSEQTRDEMLRTVNDLSKVHNVVSSVEQRDGFFIHSYEAHMIQKTIRIYPKEYCK